MTAALIICLTLGGIFGLGVLFGAIMHFGNASTERPIRVHRGEIVPLRARRGQITDIRA